MNLGEILLKKRPTLGESSIKTYTSVLKSLHKKVFGKDTEIKTDNFNGWIKTDDLWSFTN